jgi:hypothetical protein
MGIRGFQWFLVAACLGSFAVAFDHTASAFEITSSLATAVACGLCAWGIHRRARFAWPLGWALIVFGGIFSVVQVATTLAPQPYRWVGILGAAVGVILVVAYWGTWWQRHREYFTPEGASPTWRPDLSPLRWFGIVMFVLALIFIFAALLASVLDK